MPNFSLSLCVPSYPEHSQTNQIEPGYITTKLWRKPLHVTWWPINTARAIGRFGTWPAISHWTWRTGWWSTAVHEVIGNKWRLFQPKTTWNSTYKGKMTMRREQNIWSMYLLCSMVVWRCREERKASFLLQTFTTLTLLWLRYDIIMAHFTSRRM